MALQERPDDYEVQGRDQGRAVVIRKGAEGVLGWIKREVLGDYERKIKAAGGIDLHGEP